MPPTLHSSGHKILGKEVVLADSSSQPSALAQYLPFTLEGILLVLSHALIPSSHCKNHMLPHSPSASNKFLFFSAPLSVVLFFQVFWGFFNLREPTREYKNKVSQEPPKSSSRLSLQFKSYQDSIVRVERGGLAASASCIREEVSSLQSTALSHPLEVKESEERGNEKMSPAMMWKTAEGPVRCC